MGFFEKGKENLHAKGIVLFEMNIDDIVKLHNLLSFNDILD